jgi:hypothetical protein
MSSIRLRREALKTAVRLDHAQSVGIDSQGSLAGFAEDVRETMAVYPWGSTAADSIYTHLNSEEPMLLW